MDYQQWQEDLYRDTYEATIKAIEYRRNSDPEYTIEELRRQLETMYIIEGNNYGGRGLSAQIDLEATIAGLQVALNQWQNEGENPQV